MSGGTFLDGRVVLHAGDCLDVVKALPDCSIDAVATDPPYALVSIQKRFGKPGAAPAQEGRDGLYKRASAGFMGKNWDTGEVAFAAEFWAEILRVLKPGGHVVAFAGTRTYHRLACAIEDAGFEIRDQLQWLYGSGFPKGHDVARALPDWQGWGTALKPAVEPIVLARKGLIGTVAANVLAHGTGAINVGACRVESSEDCRRSSAGGENGLSGSGTFKIRQRFLGDGPPRGGRWPANVLHDGSDEVSGLFPSDADGSAARFFYSAKADSHDRIGSKHPTVKPVALMQWLCRLVTPPGGVVLDPFAGTGTTGEAAWREGYSAVLIEREAEYRADIARRMELATAGRTTRAAEASKARNAQRAGDHGPLFGGAPAEGGQACLQPLCQRSGRGPSARSG